VSPWANNDPAPAPAEPRAHALYMDHAGRRGDEHEAHLATGNPGDPFSGPPA
jgi:hypothetical protein